MRRRFSRVFCLRILPAFLALFAAGCAQEPVLSPRTPISRIAFGSCASQKKPQPIWDQVLANRPQLFIFSGDNVYADTDDPEEMRAAYEQLGAIPGYQRLRQTCPILATWDDHDYGKNDAGAEWVMKEEAQRLFLDFFEDPPGSARRSTPGIYDAVMLGPKKQRIQVILLDTRYFRSPLNEIPRKERVRGFGKYQASEDPESTFLGEVQWSWLKEQLKKPAKLRLIVSSIQVLTTEHGWECWNNFPHERERLLELVKNTRANGVVFITGDRHHGEIARMDEGMHYPIYDVTSSGLNQGRPPTPEPNRFRRGALCLDRNFGIINIDWKTKDPVVSIQIRDGKNKVRAEEKVHLKKLNP